jgi:hypothetical protein
MCCGCAFADAVALTVRVRDHAGVPVRNAPVEYGIGKESKFGMTDASGEVVGNFTIVAGDREASARLWDGEGHSLPPSESAIAANRYDEIAKSTYSDRIYVSAVPTDDRTHVLTIDLKEAVAISLRLTGDKEHGGEITIGTREGLSHAMLRLSIAGTLNGVRKQAATHLWAIGDTSEVWIRPLTVAETSRDINLGDIVFPMPTCTSPVAVTMTNHTDLWASPIIELRNMATFIKKDDGRVFLSFVNRKTNQTEERKGTNEAFMLPPGEYYVVPGCFGADIHWKVYDLVKAGRQAALDAVRVPIIPAADGKNATLTVDAKKVMEAIRSIP